MLALLVVVFLIIVLIFFILGFLILCGFFATCIDFLGLCYCVGYLLLRLLFLSEYGSADVLACVLGLHITGRLLVHHVFHHGLGLLCLRSRVNRLRVNSGSLLGDVRCLDFTIAHALVEFDGAIVRGVEVST